MGTFNRWEYSKQEQIFSEDERKEIWVIIKQAVAGKINDKDLQNYIEMLNKAIDQKLGKKLCQK